ncbi:MAG: DEAD/DEAH box helicase [Deltaproteobacteria bacterium]|nr:DEAD/DEAH box helicase [Deltaproteobacteria bacterium]
MLRLRAWQREALTRFEESPRNSFLAVATPGAGKTAFALTAVQRALIARRAQRLVVVVPTQHLKQQWAHAAEPFGLHLDPDWSPGYGTLPSDVHGIVVTYQQVATNPGALRPLVRGAFAVLDEIHHAGESRTWGDSVRTAFEHAAFRLCLSGTPFRSDQNTIPFVCYDGDLAEADYEYGYGRALEDGGVVRPVYFPRINGHMEWTAPGGTDYAATFDDPLTRDLSNQRLRTALNVEGEWLPAILEQAHAQLNHLRQRDPRAGGLVIAMDQEHARGIAQVMADRLRVVPVVATSDEASASKNISNFVNGNAPWIVAVRMVSEGVDIPRLRVGVYATNTITDLFFRQAVGRLVRWVDGLGRQGAYMFIPDDLRLRTFGAAIAEQRRHSLRRPNADAADDNPWGNDGDGPPREASPEREMAPDGQLSLFTAISAVPLDEQGRRLEAVRLFDADMGDPLSDIPDLAPDAASRLGGGGGTAGFSFLRMGGAGALLTAPSPVPVPLPTADPRSAPAALGAMARRRQLREQNSEAVADLARMTGKTHAETNAELNRRIRVRRISEATVRQLQQRLDLARKLLRG